MVTMNFFPIRVQYILNRLFHTFPELKIDQVTLFCHHVHLLSIEPNLLLHSIDQSSLIISSFIEAAVSSKMLGSGVSFVPY